MESEDEKAAQKEKQEIQEKHAEIVRVLWRHENDLMNTRLNSFVTMQTLLFAGLGVALQNKLGIIIDTICVLGVLVSYSTFVVFQMGFEGTKNLLEWWKGNLLEYRGPGITGNAVRAKRGGKIKSLSTPGNLLPPAFLLAWVILTYFLFHFHYFTNLSR